MDWPGHIPPHIHNESHSNINLCPLFCLKAYLCCTEPFRKKSYGSRVYSWRHICLPVLSVGLYCLQTWELVFPWCPSSRQLTGREFLPQPDIIFTHTLLLQIDTRIQFSELSLVSVSNQLVGKCQTLTHIMSCRYVWLSGCSSLQYWANSCATVFVVLALDSLNHCSVDEGPTAQHPFSMFAHMASLS